MVNALHMNNAGKADSNTFIKMFVTVLVGLLFYNPIKYLVVGLNTTGDSTGSAIASFFAPLYLVVVLLVIVYEVKDK